METDLTAQALFQQKMMDRIRNDIGMLLPDVVLKDMVEKAVHQTFFEKRPKPGASSWDKEQYLPPLLQVILKELLSEHVKLAVDTWLKENANTVKEQVAKTVTDGVGMAMVRAISSAFQTPLQQFQTDVMLKLEPPR